MRLESDSKFGLIITKCYLFIFSVIIIASMSGAQKIKLTKQPKVVVIGAGASGVAATTELVRVGFENVTLLEAENRIGGRVFSTQLFGEQLVDLGAEFYEGLQKDVVWEMTKPIHNKLLAQPSAEFKLYNSNGTMVDEEMRQNLFKFLNEFQEDESCNNLESVGECFDLKYEALINSSTNANYTEFLKRSITWSRTMLHLFSMAPDLYRWGLGTHPVKGPLWAWKNQGYKVVIDILLERFPDPSKYILRDDQVLLNKEVVKIEDWRDEDNTIKVKCSDNTTYEADHVFCTVSLGVLQATHNKMFEPVLPESKIEAIEKTGFGPLLKIVVHFKEMVQLNGSLGVVWEQNEFNELKSDRDLHWLLWLSFIIPTQNNPKALVCFFTGPGAYIIESISDDVVMSGIGYLTEKVLKRQGVVKHFPDQFIRTLWSTNPHFQGVNSFKTVHGDFQKALACPIPSEDNPRILFAGEATHPEYYTTVHGAVETGLKEARRLRDMYRDLTTEKPLF